MLTRLACAAALLTAVGTTFAADFPTKDVVQGQDHPLLSRYQGSRMVGYLTKKYDDTVLVGGPYKSSVVKGPRFEKLLTVEGKITRIAYNFPTDRSGLEVMRNYRSAIQSAGMTVVFSCDKDACGAAQFGGEFLNLKIDRAVIAFVNEVWAQSPFNYGRTEPRYILATTKRADGALTYASVYVVPPLNGQNGGVFVEIVEPESMETGKVSVNLTAEQMAKGIAMDGKVALYGLYFDTDKAEVRPDSKPTLEEMAKMLSQHAALEFYIVGHTDNQGTYAHNLDLSQRRADAVVKALTAQYQIEARRLTAKGVASVAPVASNDSEEGRARNRRVELVKQ